MAIRVTRVPVPPKMSTLEMLALFCVIAVMALVVLVDDWLERRNWRKANRG